ncbi:MAG: PrgI family protein [Candidatus Nanohalobium sp.]
MAYKLPKDLRYKEKIVGNLNWKQTLYLGTGFLIAVTVLVQRPLPLSVRVVSALFAVFLSLGFAFMGLESGLKDRIVFLRTVSEAGYLDDEAYSFLGVEDVRDSGVVVGEECFYCFVEVEPVNLDVLNVDERNLVLSQYEDFLNSLEFPIHINVRTVDAVESLDSHFESFEEKIDDGDRAGRQFFEEYRDYWKGFVEEHGIKKRKYYIVIPSRKSDVHVAEEELMRRVELVRQKLPERLASKRLNKFEVTRLLASFFGDFVDFENHYFSPFTLSMRKKNNR